jgi:hypothetical protein
MDLMDFLEIAEARKKKEVVGRIVKHRGALP